MDKYLICLGAGNDQIPMYERARKLGIKTIGVDYNPKSPAFDYCDIPLIVSIKHPDVLIPALEAFSTEFKFMGVMTMGVEISPIVSMVAKHFGLTAVDELTAYITTNKCARCIRLSEHGIPIPQYQIISDSKSIYIDMPYVVKPSDSSASRGVRRVDRESDVVSTFDEAQSYSTDNLVLVEEMLKGDEISIEGFMVDGKMYVTGFADRNYATVPNTIDQPYFIENGGSLPTRLSDDIYQQACDVFTEAVLACGITNGPSKGDLLVQDGKVYVIEITSRLSGGGFCSRTQLLNNGTDIITATIQWHCGLPVDTDLLTPKFNKAVAHRFYFHDSGIITSITGIDRIMEMPGVKYYVQQYPFEEGFNLDTVSYINRLFYVITQADTISEAIKLADDAIYSVKINTIKLDLTK